MSKYKNIYQYIMKPSHLHLKKNSSSSVIPQAEREDIMENDQFFDDSLEIVPVKDEEYENIGAICKREAEDLERRKLTQEEKIQSLIKKKKNGGVKYNQDEGSSSQYHPQSGVSSSHNSQELQGEKINSDLVKTLHAMIRTQQIELADPQTKVKKIKEIAAYFDISSEIVRRKVYDYFRKRKGGSSSKNTPEQKYEHQTIYRKTEMFDDAIKRVLKKTPYACINDLREQIKDVLGLQLAKQTLIRRLKNLNYNYQKFAINKMEREDDKTKKIKKQFIKLYKQVTGRRFPIFFFGVCHLALDECKGSMWMKNKQNGQLDHMVYQKDVVHIILILSKEKVQFYRIFKGFYSKKSYLATLQAWIQKMEYIPKQPKINKKTGHVIPQTNQTNHNPRPCYLFVQANLIHFSEGIIQNDISHKLKQKGVFMQPMPMYASSLNPAWMLFNHIKYYTRGKVTADKAKNHKLADLIESVESVIKNNVDFKDIDFAFTAVTDSFVKI